MPLEIEKAHHHPMPVQIHITLCCLRQESLQIYFDFLNIVAGKILLFSLRYSKL